MMLDAPPLIVAAVSEPTSPGSRSPSHRSSLWSSVESTVVKEYTNSALALLEIHDLAVHFGAVRACDGISLTADHGQVLGVVGPNGSGKTTLFRAICGDVRPTGGRVTWQGR